MKAIIEQDYTDIRLAFINAKMFPMCGWAWLEDNINKKHPEQTMTIFYDDKWVAELSANKKHTRKGMREIIKIAQM